MSAQHTRLATLWLGLEEIKNKIDNEVVPLGLHLGMGEQELFDDLTALSEKIEAHFERNELVIKQRAA